MLRYLSAGGRKTGSRPGKFILSLQIQQKSSRDRPLFNLPWQAGLQAVRGGMATGISRFWGTQLQLQGFGISRIPGQISRTRFRGEVPHRGTAPALAAPESYHSDICLDKCIPISLVCQEKIL